MQFISHANEQRNRRNPGKRQTPTAREKRCELK